jgi:hypothetical protein
LRGATRRCPSSRRQTRALHRGAPPDEATLIRRPPAGGSARVALAFPRARACIAISGRPGCNLSYERRDLGALVRLGSTSSLRSSSARDVWRGAGSLSWRPRRRSRRRLVVCELRDRHRDRVVEVLARLACEADAGGDLAALDPSPPRLRGRRGRAPARRSYAPARDAHGGLPCPGWHRALNWKSRVRSGRGG